MQKPIPHSQLLFLNVSYARLSIVSQNFLSHWRSECYPVSSIITPSTAVGRRVDTVNAQLRHFKYSLQAEMCIVRGNFFLFVNTLKIITLRASEAAAQCIVIAPVCLCLCVCVWGGSVTAITRNCVHRSSPNWVVTISSWLNFCRPAPPGRGFAAERKSLAPPYYSHRAVFVASLSTPIT